MKPLASSQHVYLTGRSAETVLILVVSLIETQVESGDFAVGTFIDIEGVDAAKSRFKVLLDPCDIGLAHMLTSHAVTATKPSSRTGVRLSTRPRAIRNSFESC